MPETASFLSNCTSGGCGAKIGPGELSSLLADIASVNDPRLLVGFDAADDAAVYQIDENTSVISTVDFFSPMVEDPSTFGRIAAANALSDVWAMGGRPVLALNLVCFPEKMDKAILGQILAGGAEKLAEAGVPLGGGHSIYDKEPKYGLAVTGLAKTASILHNNTPRPGDVLLLTKPLGVGIVMAAARADEADPEHYKRAVDNMERLNLYAAQKLAGYDVSACTDITGFGLLAHALEMAGENASLLMRPHSLPVLPGALQYASDYLLTAAGQRNRNHLAGKCDISRVPFAYQELLFDPQTSGGLLIAVAQEQADALLAEIQTTDPDARAIGGVLPQQSQPLIMEVPE